MKQRWDALISDYFDHLLSGRCEDPEGIKEEIERLRELQRVEQEKAA